MVLLFVWSKTISSSVTENSSLLSVELLDMIDMARLLTRLPTVKVIREDAMAAKSVPSVGIIITNRTLSS